MLAPTTATPAEPWVRSVGAPIRVPYRGTVAPIAPFAYRRTRAALAAFRPDVVHVHEPLTPSASMFAALAATAPVVATVHAYLDRSVAMELAAPILRRVWNRVHRRCRRLRGRGLVPAPRRACGGARDRAERRRRLGLLRGAEPRTDLPAGRRILWVNRLDAQKGFPVALAAFSKVLVDIPDATLIVVGEGKDRESLRLLTEQALARVDMRGRGRERGGPRLPRRVRGVRRVRRRAGELRDRDRRGDGGRCSRSWRATSPGYREVVTDGVDGLLVPPRDPEALAAGLVRVLRGAGAGEAARRGRPRARPHVRLADRRRPARGAVRPRDRDRWLR